MPHYETLARKAAPPRVKLADAGEIGVAVGKMMSKYKTGKHFTVAITDDSLPVAQDQAQIGAEASLDGFYMLRTPVPVDQNPAPPGKPGTRPAVPPPPRPRPLPGTTLSAAPTAASAA